MSSSRVLAAGAAFFLLVAGCAPPPKTVANFASPSASASPSPSPTPTAPLTTSAPGFHIGEVGVAYAPVTITPSGGRAPYGWSISAGALPAGLALGPDGAVSGTPTTAGTFSFTIKLSDSGDSTASIPGQIAIAAHVQASLLPACAEYCNVELGCTTACGLFGTLGGGVAPYTYAVTGGTLPAGTSLSTLALTGTFTGQTGWLQFTVTVTDGLGATAAVSPKFWMYDHITLPDTKCSSGLPRLGTSCKVTISYAGGTPNQQVTLTVTGWTPGSCSFTAFIPCAQPAVTAAYQPGQVTLTLTYGANYPGTVGTLAVQLTSTDQCAASTPCSATAKVTVSG